MANTYSTVNLPYPQSNGQTITVANGATMTAAWIPPRQNFVSNDGQSIMSIPNGSKTVVLEETATLEIKGNVKINGIDLEERLKTIERVLMIPERDATMEAKYPSLKKKYDEYINALEKYKTFERIKGDSDGTT